ncbi:response regulator transcription factor [Rarobacter faecitabidus]|uniref:LuxR family two component transcriptional regulator n=1 Tax=Rarobacter faecitabidus TaxID=13243 RepID=A0A542ZXC9_RARFA|nr:response regulator transcription factor [Rarobacter faecitabidus]TQL65012.1 LuxR family two component transcriptional regulator [Rarobacter faecitabidus]
MSGNELRGQGDSEAGSDGQASGGKLRIVVVDDHAMFRAGVISTLPDDFLVVGQAGDVDTAVSVIGEARPDVVLLDVHLPGGDGGGGAEVAARCTALGLPARMLALSVSDAAQDVVGVIRGGARGYVTKTIEPDALADAVRRVRAGDAVFSPMLAGFVLDSFGATQQQVAQEDDELDLLSAREQEVMRLIARGYSYREVASELFISIKTVETHVSAVLRKLQLSSRHEITRWAAARRLL